MQQAPVFLLLGLGMLALGVGVGLVFPGFAVVLGVPARHVESDVFRGACLGAGLLLAGTNWCLARCIVGRRLRRLSTGLTAVADHVVRVGGTLDRHEGSLATKLPPGASDDLGAAARAFNSLLDALERERRFRTVIHASSDVTVMVDSRGRVVFASASVRHVLGWDPATIIGSPLLDAVHHDDRSLLEDLLHPTAGHSPARTPHLAKTTGTTGAVADASRDREPPERPITVRVLTRGCGTRSLELSVRDHRHDPAVAALVLTGRDVTERVVLQRELVHQALHDVLTGLPNRAALQQRTAELQAAPRPALLSVALMDLDRFKEINDTLGHDYGDKLLAQVGPRLQALVRPGDLLVRLGGDEFAILMVDVDVETALAVARRARAALQQPFDIDGMLLEVDASIGVASSRQHFTAGTEADLTPPPGPAPAPGHAGLGASGRPGHTASGPGGDTARPDPSADRGAGVNELLRMADVAMYEAKKLQTGVERYDPRSDTNDRTRLTLLTDLRHALAHGELLLHYQPKLHLSDGTLAGVEALVRWQHPTRGLLHPGDFLPAVEPTGLIWPLTLAVLDLALEQVSAWDREGHDVQVAVNLSARCLHRADLADQVLARLALHDVPARLLRLELTESALMAEPDRALEHLRQLAEAGVRLSIDDFGTGYSSMSYLRRLPIDELKVDRSFVADVAGRTTDDVLVRSIVELGHSLGLSVVAEGVEQAATHTALQGLRCDIGQGYHYARPQPAAQLTSWLTTPAGRPVQVLGTSA